MKKRPKVYDSVLNLIKNLHSMQKPKTHHTDFETETESLVPVQKKENTQKRNEFICRIIAITSAFLLIFSTVLAASEIKETAKIYDDILRLHVIANSDEKGDQELKLKVRDAVLSELSNAMDNAKDLAQAKTVAKKNTSSLISAAERVITENGYSDSVKIDFVREYYPTKEYEGVKLPAGIYNSVKITIGEGNGKNWWCVLFPALCTNMATPTETFQQVGFTPGQIKVLTESENPKYVLKFRILEIIGEFSGKLFN